MTIHQERITLYGALMLIIGAALGIAAAKVGEAQAPALPLVIAAAVVVVILAALAGGAWLVERGRR